MRIAMIALTVLAATPALATERGRRATPALQEAAPLKDAAALRETAPEPPPRPPAARVAPGAPRADALPDDPPTPPPRPDALAPEPAATAAPPPAPAPLAADACLVELAALGADAPKAEAPPAGEAGCAIETPVRLKSVSVRDGRIAVHGEPLIACATARAAALYVAQTLAPVAKGATGATLSGVTAAGFECRPRNRQPGGKLSAHGKGLALDVMSFQFSDGATTTVAAPGERLAFLNGARKAACGYFTTVLGPGSDAAHRDHLHLDIEPHGSSGYGRICQ